MQASDGHLVAYSQQGRSTWASSVFGGDKTGAYALLQDDGNFVVCDQQSHALWATKTDSTHRFWMQENIDPNHTLKQVCLPGSHDAGMYEISGTKGRWSRGLAQTQERSIYDQLLTGCRYFDLRPELWTGLWHSLSEDDFYTSHGAATGPKLKDIFGHVKRFISEQSKETILLELSHWQDFEKEPLHVYEKLAEVLFSYLPEQYLLSTKATDLLILPFKYWQGKVIILLRDDEGRNFYDEVIVPQKKPGYFLYNQALRVFDEYSDTEDAPYMLANQAIKFRKFKDTDRLFMLNWTLTPYMTPGWQETGEAIV